MPSRSDGASGSWALERTVAILLGLGAALRLWQYAGNPTLWMDELALGNNLLTRPLGLLLGTPLADGQVAPPGFLIVSRAVVVAFGSSEYALRLFPLLCSLASLPLFARLATRLLRPPAALLAIALFALSPGIAIYAAEGKQYATDVLVTLALTELTLWWLAAPGARRSVALAVGGVVGVFLSQPAVFLLAGLGAALVVGTPRGDRRKPLAPMAFWVTGAVLSVVHARSRMSSGLMNYMHWFWQEGFLPWPVTSLEDALWPLRTLAGLFGLGLGYPWPWAYLTLVACGLVSLFRRARRVALLLAGPIAVTLLAAVAQVYPFQLRLVLFLVPGFVLLVAEGAGLIAERAGQMVERAPGRAVPGGCSCRPWRRRLRCPSSGTRRSGTWTRCVRCSPSCSGDVSRRTRSTRITRRGRPSVTTARATDSASRRWRSAPVTPGTSTTTSASSTGTAGAGSGFCLPPRRVASARDRR